MSRRVAIASFSYDRLQEFAAITLIQELGPRPDRLKPSLPCRDAALGILRLRLFGNSDAIELAANEPQTLVGLANDAHVGIRQGVNQQRHIVELAHAPQSADGEEARF